jgi:CheY-like chemotaxis protein
VLAEKSAARLEESQAHAALHQFRYRALIVDDEPSIREIMTTILESEGFEVHTATNGFEGLQALSRSLPDIIISDLNMPRMSGFEFLGIVRMRFPQIATIAMSGEYLTSQNQRGILSDAFLQKGHFNNDELTQAVKKLLAVSPSRSERENSGITPLFVSRDDAGFLVFTCVECDSPNALQATGLNGGIHQTPCQSCGVSVKFQINQA